LLNEEASIFQNILGKVSRLGNGFEKRMDQTKRRGEREGRSQRVEGAGYGRRHVH
jgi:hypothetical protein